MGVARHPGKAISGGTWRHRSPARPSPDRRFLAAREARRLRPLPPGRKREAFSLALLCQAQKTATVAPARARAARMATTPRASLDFSRDRGGLVEKTGLTSTASAPSSDLPASTYLVRRCAAVDTHAIPEDRPRIPHAARATRPRCTPSAPTSRAMRASPFTTSHAPTDRVATLRRPANTRRLGLRRDRSRSCTAQRSGREGIGARRKAHAALDHVVTERRVGDEHDARPPSFCHRHPHRRGPRARDLPARRRPSDSRGTAPPGIRACAAPRPHVVLLAPGTCAIAAGAAASPGVSSLLSAGS